MKKYLAWFAVLLIVFSALVCQWLRADERSALLGARIHEVEKDLIFIRKVKLDLPIFERQIRGQEYQLTQIQKRLPPESGTESFAAELVSRFKENTIELQLLSVKREDREYYTETEIIFVLSEQVPVESKFVDVFKNQERLVHWKFAEQDKKLMVTVYNSPVEMETPRVLPCRAPVEGTLQYWPFNSSLEKKIHHLDRLCSSWNNKLQLLEKAEYLKRTTQKVEMLTRIVDELQRKSRS